LIWRLNATNGGWVDGGKNNISTSVTTYITSNVELRNVKFFLNNNANCTILKNSGWSNSYNTPTENIHDVYIHDCSFDGNAINQPVWSKSGYPTTGDMRQGSMAINFIWTNDTTIEHCSFNDTVLSSIIIEVCSNFNIRDCTFNGAGMTFYSGSHQLENGRAIYIRNGQNFTIDGIKAWNCYTGAIAVETGANIQSAYVQTGSNNFHINNVFFDTGFSGMWFEGADSEGLSVKYGTITNCIMKNINIRGAYTITNEGNNYAYAIMRNTFNLKFTNCEGYNIGSTTAGYSYKGSGVWFTGENNTFMNGCINNVYGNGTTMSGRNNKFIGNTINCTYGTGTNGYGIFISSSTDTGFMFPTVSYNTIGYTERSAIYMTLSNGGTNTNKINKGGQITNNIIRNAKDYTQSSTYGIWVKSSNVTITDNTIYHYYKGIYLGWSGAYTGIYEIVNNNHITDTYQYGIDLWCSNSTFNNNVIETSRSTTGIYLNNGMRNNTFVGNIVKTTGYGIRETSLCNYNIICMNNCLGCTTAPIVVVGANTLCAYNFGVVS